MKIKETAGTAARHTFPVTIYWEDTDAAGVVYYANYLRYAERARSEILDAFGLDQRRMKDEDDVMFAVRRCHAEYLAPGHLGDKLEVHTHVLDVKGASFDLRQSVLRGAEELVVMDVRLAGIGANGKPKRLPAEVRAALAGAEN
ncbi:MAG: YbgC/FadM family acyl-CoA thioesterase [Rhodospirillales bacterium]|nr:YbgC/FadM family acyl-CoA thioesterase [Rhodospirillales bacterium]